MKFSKCACLFLRYKGNSNKKAVKTTVSVSRHYVDQGEYDQAVRYLNLLKGPSLQLASDWIHDVVVYLETSQAVETLMAHASVAGLHKD